MDRYNPPRRNGNSKKNEVVITGGRTQRIDFEKDVNKTTILPRWSFGRPKRPWSCTQHLRKTRTVIIEKRATLEEVKERMEYWRRQLLEPEKGSEEYSLKERVERYHQELEAKKLRRKQKKVNKEKNSPRLVGENTELAAIMGISSFGSTNL
nr:putative U4/U5/U6 small nuclear ribonucleoprotein complex subunit Snu23 [Schizosaccharomyces pombe]CAA91076.3 U4/U6 x U5 tri-snRNP complex subunit Snu23 (predicted) [Schizosaccharomyces pombe]|eukprot:NP_593030.3 putative U4/U5/U6 small nuclear ribonucleoprotein complex subunit Snu23 [Schizosaccharomyces pombe]